MARKSAITPDTVAEAAEALQADGIEVTNKSVLDRIGSGSLSTLAPLLRAWREAQEEREELAEVAVPEVVNQHVGELMGRIWRNAVDHATAGHDAMRRELAETRADADKAYAEIVENLKGIERERDLALATLTEEKNSKSACEERITKMERDMAGLNERVVAKEAEATTAREASKAAQEREAEMRLERDRSLEKVESATAETAEVQATLSDQLADARDRTSKQLDRLEKVQGDLATMQSDLSAERVQHGHTQEKLKDVTERAEADAAKYEASLGELRAERDKAQADRDKLQAELDGVRRDLVEAHREAARLAKRK